MGLMGNWGGRFKSSGENASGGMKLRITEKDNENYTGHVLEFELPTSWITKCEGAEMKINRSRGNLYAVTWSVGRRCQAEGELEYTSQTLIGKVLVKGWMGAE